MSKNTDATIALLETHFDIAFAAPDGIKKLRELILSLAMQGKLVPQDPSNQPASELLKEIEAEKKRLVKEGKIKQSKPLPEIKPEELPYDLPKGWEWVRLRELGEAQTGATPSTKNAENFGNFISFIGPGDIKNYRIDYSGQGLSEIGIIKGRLIQKNSVLMVCIGGSIGKHAINDRDITCNQQINTITSYNHESTRYIFFAMGEKYFQTLVVNQSSGSATPIINKQKWSSIPVPLPPLAEQRRIVAKIDELMARCDELERLRSDRDRKQIIVHTAALNRLLIAKEQSDFNTAWQFITQHFSELYSVKENVAELRKVILQLAVMGKLVPQDPSDQPANELLKEIEKEKEKLVKEGKIKKSKPLPEVTPDEFPYHLPKSWKWVRLGELTQVITKGSSPNWQGIQYVNEGEGILFITSENVGNYNLLLKKRKFVEFRFNEIEPRSILQKSDILMNIVGASIGRTAIFNLNEIANINQAVTIIRLIHPVNHKYFLHFFNSPTCIGYMYDKQVENARPNLSMGNITLFNIPLPPLTEQHRIVAKIDQLMALCDNIEKQIDAANSKQTNLLNAVMTKI